MLANYHTHTLFCDGKNTPEEIVQRAIELGLSELGFSGHSYTAFDESYCMSKENTEKYKKEINALKRKYQNQIKILLGVEQDYFSDESTEDYDYVIGSVHYIFKDNVYIPVDESRAIQTEAVNQHYNGDFYAFAEDYYALVADLYRKTKCDIIGHFDLIKKFNADGTLFDPDAPRYVAAWRQAAQRLVRTPAVFEINTGGMAAGYVKETYPSECIIKVLKSNRVKTLFSSDCHDAEHLMFGYDIFGCV